MSEKILKIVKVLFSLFLSMFLFIDLFYPYETPQQKRNYIQPRRHTTLERRCMDVVTTSKH